MTASVNHPKKKALLTNTEAMLKHPRRRVRQESANNSDEKKSPSKSPSELCGTKSMLVESNNQEMQGKKKESPSKGKHPAIRSHHKKKNPAVSMDASSLGVT